MSAQSPHKSGPCRLYGKFSLPTKYRERERCSLEEKAPRSQGEAMTDLSEIIEFTSLDSLFGGLLNISPSLLKGQSGNMVVVKDFLVRTFGSNVTYLRLADLIYCSSIK